MEYMIPWTRMSQSPKRHLDRFGDGEGMKLRMHACALCAQQTDPQTTLRAKSRAVFRRIYAMHAMSPKNE